MLFERVEVPAAVQQLVIADGELLRIQQPIEQIGLGRGSESPTTVSNP